MSNTQLEFSLSPLILQVGQRSKTNSIHQWWSITLSLILPALPVDSHTQAAGQYMTVGNHTKNCPKKRSTAMPERNTGSWSRGIAQILSHSHSVHSLTHSFTQSTQLLTDLANTCMHANRMVRVRRPNISLNEPPAVLRSGKVSFTLTVTRLAALTRIQKRLPQKLFLSSVRSISLTHQLYGSGSAFSLSPKNNWVVDFYKLCLVIFSLHQARARESSSQGRRQVRKLASKREEKKRRERISIYPFCLVDILEQINQ